MPKKDDPWDDPGWKAYAQHAMDTLEPMVRDSAVALALVPPGDRVDPKIAMEMGYMILLDKPIIAIVNPDCKPSSKLVAVADELVEGTIDDPDFQQRLMAAMDRVTKKMEGKK